MSRAVVVDNEWFRATFPAPVETLQRRSSDPQLGDVTTHVFVATLDGEVGAYGVEVVVLPTPLTEALTEDLWRKVGPALVQALSDGFIDQFGGQSTSTKGKASDESFEAQGEFARQLAFLPAQPGGIIYLKTITWKRTIVKLYVFAPPGDDGLKAAYGFFDAITFK